MRANADVQFNPIWRYFSTLVNFHVLDSDIKEALSAGAVGYTDCTSAAG